jgi:hypothetical protein
MCSSYRFALLREPRVLAASGCIPCPRVLPGGAMAVIVGRLVGATVLWTAIGVGLGLAVKHQVAAIAGALVWLLAAEGILSGLMPDVARYFPGAAGFAVVGINSAELLMPALGAALLGAYAVVAIAAGGFLVQRRDIA